jgi:hypothetical protein
MLCAHDDGRAGRGPPWRPAVPSPVRLVAGKAGDRSQERVIRSGLSPRAIIAVGLWLGVVVACGPGELLEDALGTATDPVVIGAYRGAGQFDLGGHIRPIFDFEDSSPRHSYRRQGVNQPSWIGSAGSRAAWPLCLVSHLSNETPETCWRYTPAIYIRFILMGYEVVRSLLLHSMKRAAFNTGSGSTHLV